MNAQLWTALKNFPTYILGWFVGLFIAVINDYAITGFALAGVFVGLAYGVSLGLATFFLLYSLFRIVSNHAEAIHSGGASIARSIQGATREAIAAFQDDSDAF